MKSRKPACNHTRLTLRGPCPVCGAVFDEKGNELDAPKLSGPLRPDRASGDFAPRPWSATADYYIAGGHDIRDVIEVFGLNYNRGAVMKYMARAGRKPGNDALLDMRKAREHIDREIARLTQFGVDPVVAGSEP